MTIRPFCAAVLVSSLLLPVFDRVASAADAPASLSPDACLYLPPSFADRVVFYDGFDRAGGPEINRLHAEVTGDTATAAGGFAGNGYQASRATQHQAPLEIHSPLIDASRPLTVMRCWRVDAPMQETSSFQLLALLGHGHISCFVHGAGEWCALKRPTIFVQIDSIPLISNVNQAVLDNAYFQPGQWHHMAITVANATDVRFYLDGTLLTTVQAKGRPFKTGDVNTLQPSSSAANFGEHPTTTDDLIVVDRVLSGTEIEQYWRSAQRLKEMQFPALLPTPTPTPPAER